MLRRNDLGCIVFERRVGQPYVFGDTFILCHFVFEHHLTLTTQRITFKGESKLIYVLCHLRGSPFKTFS